MQEKFGDKRQSTESIQQTKQNTAFTTNQSVLIAGFFILRKGAEPMQEIQDLKQEIQQIKSDQKDMQRDIRNLETRTTVNEKDIVNINKLLDKISANTTWILRLIVGGLIGAAITFLLKGGGM